MWSLIALLFRVPGGSAPSRKPPERTREPRILQNGLALGDTTASPVEPQPVVVPALRQRPHPLRRDERATGLAGGT